jgi:hypothetical protein
VKASDSENQTGVLKSRVFVLQAESYTAQDAETLELPDQEMAQASNDAFFKLERGVEDRRRGREGAERLAELREDSEAKYKDDYSINKALRRQLRCVSWPACLSRGYSSVGMRPGC